jgi:hypothetical protein
VGATAAEEDLAEKMQVGVMKSGGKASITK